MARPNVNSRQFVLFGVLPSPQRYSDTVFPLWIVIGKTGVVGMFFGMAPKPQALFVLLQACLARIASNDLKETIGVIDWPETCKKSHNWSTAAPRHRKFALPEALKAFSRFTHISFREQEIRVPEGEPIGEKENPLQYKGSQEARQVETLVEVDVHTSWQNIWVFNIGVISYYRRPAYVLHETLLKNAPLVAYAPTELVAYAPTEPKLLYALQLLRPLRGSSVDL